LAKYAQDTEVSSEKSRAEIERTLTRYGASAFMYGWQGDKAVIGFKAHDRMLRFVLPMPDKKAREFTHTRHENQWSQRQLSVEASAERYEQAIRQRWRALALVIKAKLEAVEAGIVEFESEFLAQIVLPGGQTMAEHSRPLIQRAYETGEMPMLLPHIQ
jgi:ABC-type bacteriocin/lantibiotic exporter with double-glycine peptidase domain